MLIPQVPCQLYLLHSAGNILASDPKGVCPASFLVERVISLYIYIYLCTNTYSDEFYMVLHWCVDWVWKCEIDLMKNWPNLLLKFGTFIEHGWQYCCCWFLCQAEQLESKGFKYLMDLMEQTYVHSPWNMGYASAFLWIPRVVMCVAKSSWIWKKT